ncbi:protein-disulfide reductase DsbD family protein [Brevundimonas aveniformis]|uniref:protein-disulfide reductase DsbD family protein n=1 Tax=Brevundimonas aveniformis TaxID=370977 RepID=UPI00041A9552|nr:thioredoxin family protein [Brevundimonas aveniformis]
MFARLVLLVLALACLTPFPAMAQPVDTGHLQAQLVPQTRSVVPGGMVYVAVVQDIDPDWHTYWINPGDVGQATQLVWHPGPDVEIGEAVWPVPARILTVAGEDRFSSYAYEGRVITPIPVAVPAFATPGTSLPVRLSATFFVCSDTLCIPESAELSLELPVRSERPELDRRWGALINQALAVAPAEGDISGRVSSTTGVVSFAFAGPALEGIDADGAYFLPDRPGVIDQAAVQRVERGPRGLILSAPAAQTLVPLTGSVSGILATSRGAWTVNLTAGPPPAGSFGRGSAQPASLTGSLDPSAGIGLWAALGLAFLGGLILNIMPCVFPILSMKAASLAATSAQPQAARREGLGFLIGVLLTFLALAGVLLTLRSGGEAAGWGFQLQNPAVVAILALIMLAAALNLSGVFHVGAWAQRLGAEAGDSLEGPLARIGPWAGSALTGALAVVVAAPCTAPFMAAALGYAVTQPAGTALLVFAALGLGFATPFVLIAFSPMVISVLPRPGPWLSRTKAILALPMYGAALWLGWVFWRQAGPGPVLVLTGTAAIFAAAAWVYGRRQTARLEGWTYPPSPVVLAILICLSGVGLVWAATAPREVAGAGADLGAEAWSTERLTALRAEGRPVLVNFTADWCLSCKTNEATALSSRRVADALARTDTAYLLADWTRRDDRIGAELARHGRSGVPLYLVYPADGGDPEVLPQLLTEGRVVSALEAAAASRD